MEKVSFIPLGGVTGVTKNMYLYEYKDEVLIVDCGLGFADETMVGVDLLLPDITYLKNLKKKIVGMVITHGHEDHIGALPYILPELPYFEIYATPLASAFANEKLAEFGVTRKVRVASYENELKLGSFTASFIRITHSIPDSSSIFIKTPVGNFYHGADFKFDLTPYDGKKTDFAKITRLSSEGVLCLMSDALGSERPGFTLSEIDIASEIEDEMRETTGKFLFTTYSSNVSRLNQAVHAAEKLGRKVCFIGRSLIKARDIAKSLSYMDYPPSLEIDVKSLKNYKDHDLCLLVAGSQGQETSALSRIANGDFREVQIKNGDTVIFSADPIPGNEVSVNSLVDQISLAGAKVVYSDIDSGFHVSGHGSQGDLLLMMALTKPRYVLPIGSTYRHMVAYKNLAKKIGYSENDVLLPDDGAEIIFTKDGVSRGQKINIRNVFVDEISGEEVESMVLRDREKLSKEGMVVVMTEIDSNTGELINSPNVVARGFSVSEINTLTKGLSGELRKSMGSKKGRVADWGYVRKTIGTISEKFIFQKLRRRPLVLPIVIEV